MRVHLRWLRTLRRSPASAAAAVLTLALTVGVGTSIVAIADAVVLTPPPFADPDALVSLGERLPGDPPSAPRSIRYGTLEAWRERAGALAAIEATDSTHLTLTGAGAAERLAVTDVTPGFLSLLGVTSARGRLFQPNDIGQPVVVLTHELWRSRFAASPDAIGRDIMLGGRPHLIVGVLPAGFQYPLDAVDLFRPLPLSSSDPEGNAQHRVGAIARLRGVSPGTVIAALNEVSGRASPPARVVATPLSVRITRGAADTLALLAGAAALALLVAFANLAGLLLVRSIDRRRDLAVRTALGAPRAEIARQLLLEAGALVVPGIAAGLLLAAWFTPVAGRVVLEPFGDLAVREVAMNWRVAGIMASVSTACAGLCAWLPASLVARRGAAGVLVRGASASPREWRLRRTFATAVVAVACVLLASLTLVGRSLQHMLAVDPGFDPRGVSTFALLVQQPEPVREQFLSTLHQALESRLGPGTASVINELPLTHDGGRRFMRLTPSKPAREVILREAGPGYFDVMRIPIVEGRAFDEHDATGAPARVIVSRSLAQRWFPGEAPVGRRIGLGPGPDAPEAEIIGVAADVKHRSLDEEGVRPTVYASAWQSASSSMVLVVRSARPPADVSALVRDEVARLGPDVPIYAVQPMEEVAARSAGVQVRRVLTWTFTGFALLALVLAAAGVFGVAAHDVAARRGELAVRLALGAAPARILLRTLAQGAQMVGAGWLAGAVLSLWTARALSSVTFGIDRFDPVNLVSAAAVLLAVGAAAVLPAARRAARTDPVRALRGD